MRRLTCTTSLIPAFAAILLMLASACTTRYIEDTKIEDSDESRDVIRTVEMYRKAMEARDADMLIALASKNYFEKNGDSNSSNNYDHKGLIEFLRSPEFRRVTQVRMKIIYKSVEFSEDRNVVTVLYHYTTDFKLPPPKYSDETGQFATVSDNLDEEVWHSKADDNEMILELEGDRWYILKGM